MKTQDKDSINNEEIFWEKTDKEDDININPIPSTQNPLIKNSAIQKHANASQFQIFFLGVLFLLCRSTFISYSNMISQIYEQEGHTYLGTISVVCVWVAFGANSLFFAQNILQNVSLKFGLIICSLNFPILTITGVYGSSCEGYQENWCDSILVYFVVIFCSFLCGTLGSVLWMSQAGYLILSAPPEKLALYIGIFFALNQSAQITANILSLFILGNVSHFQYFLIIFCIALFFSFLFVTIPSVEKQQKKHFSIKENFAKITELMKNTRIKLLSIYFTSTGVCIGFYTGYLFRLIQESLESGLSRSDINVKTSYVFILLGVCSFFAGLICGKLAGKISINRLMMLSIVFLEASIVSSMFTFYSKNYALCFITGGLWGFTDSFLITLCNILVKIECGGGLEGYALLRFCTGIGVLLTCVLSMLLSGHANYIFLLIMFILQMIVMGVVIELKK